MCAAAFSVAMTSPKPDPRRRSYWLKTLHEWHWVSSALCLIGMLLFAVTGFTLNHAGQIESRPRIVRGEAALPDALRLQLVEQQALQKGDRAPVPAPFADWVRGQWGLEAEGREAEWTADELYVSPPVHQSEDLPISE
jgi:hypothetical protein